MTEWQNALDMLEDAAKQSVHSVWVDHHVKIIKDFIKTTQMYVKQLETDYDEMEAHEVRGGYGGT